MTTAEAVLRGGPPDAEHIDQAYQAILSQASFRTSRHRATSSYREHIVGVLLEETISEAFQRAG